MFFPPLAIRQPSPRIVPVQILWMFSYELKSLRPQSRDALWCIVQVDRETVCLIVVLHVSENIVIDITEKVNFWLNTPIPADICECRVFVEEARVPAAHLVVRYHVSVLDLILSEYLCRLLKEIYIDPRWYVPMFGRNFYCGETRLE